jgi:hypothetical protein
MKKTIWKYSLEVKGVQKIEMPKGARLLSVAAQYGAPQLWAEIDPAAPMGEAEIITIGTGFFIDPTGLDFVGSYQLHGGSFVGHVYGKAP